MQWMANDGQLHKQRRTDDAHDGHDHDLLVALANLSLRTADEVKELQAATFRTILVPADCDFVTAAKNATTAFADRTRGKGGKHDLGEPHVHLWSAVIGVMAPFWGTLYIRCRMIIMTQKGTLILTTTHL